MVVVQLHRRGRPVEVEGIWEARARRLEELLREERARTFFWTKVAGILLILLLLAAAIIAVWVFHG